MRVSTAKSEAMVLSQNRVDCYLQVRNKTLPQTGDLKYLRILFRNLERVEQEIDRRIRTVSVVMQTLYRSVVVKRELSQKINLRPQPSPLDQI